MKKIYISPSNQTGNRYSIGNTNEAEQCMRIANSLERILSKNDFDVMVGDSTMFAKVEESNKWGADIHVAIHTNAYDGKVSGTRIFCSSLTSEAGNAAKSVFEFLNSITPGTSSSVTVRNNLYEIVKTNAYCVYIEVEFHDSVETANWIIHHTEQIAEAIARGICKHYGIPYYKDIANPVVKRYKFMREVPHEYRIWLEKLIERGLLNGRGGNGDDCVLDMSEDVVRCLTILARAIEGAFIEYK